VSPAATTPSLSPPILPLQPSIALSRFFFYNRGGVQRGGVRQHECTRKPKHLKKKRETTEESRNKTTVDVAGNTHGRAEMSSFAFGLLPTQGVQTVSTSRCKRAFYFSYTHKKHGMRGGVKICCHTNISQRHEI
jgi:hypothetical protein